MLRAVFSLVIMCVIALAGCPPVSAQDYMEVPIYFLGDRKPRKFRKKDPGKSQLSLAQFISFGVGRYPVSPTDNATRDNCIRLGGIPMKMTKALNRLCVNSLSEQTEEVVTKLTVDETDGNPFESAACKDFISRFAEFVEDSKSEEYVVFVHGCCTSQKLALQFASDLQTAFGCPVLAFDWATPGILGAPPLPEVNTYRQSERALEISQINYNRLIFALTKAMPGKRIVVVGHSMGNRLITDFLMDKDSSNLARQIDEVHLVRADLSLPAYAFREKQLCSSVGKMIIYVADNDPMLSLSKELSSNISRLGSPGTGIKLLLGDSRALQPTNRTILDISPLQMTHFIPFDLLAEIHRGGEHTNPAFIVKPMEPRSSGIFRVERNKSPG